MTSSRREWVGAFADDGVQMPPHFPANLGKGMIRSWSHGLLQSFSQVAFALSVDEQRVSSDWAFERGQYTITLTPKAEAQSADDTGKYITAYQRQGDGSWKMARDIWNSDNAPASAR